MTHTLFRRNMKKDAVTTCRYEPIRTDTIRYEPIRRRSLPIRYDTNRYATTRRVFVSLLLVAVVLVTHAFEFKDESLNYRIMYKWGIVNKQAGHATLSLRTSGNHYNLMLTAASEPWADKFYRVRDTLSGVVEAATFRPQVYRKMSHEGGDHKHDVVTYTFSGNTVVGTCTRKKWDKNYTLKVDEKRTLTAEGMTVDMLSSFYYMRNRPYQSWQAGHTIRVNLFSGKRKELLTIRYLGIETVKIDRKEYRAYHISFTFTDPQKPKNQTSDPMEAWISADDARIPVKLEGKLKVGKVQCFFTGKSY